MQVQEKDQARKTHYRLAKLSLILFLILLFILILNLHRFPYPSDLTPRETSRKGRLPLINYLQKSNWFSYP
jgi:hypothetical protein